MANTSVIRGFEPVGYFDGAPYNGKIRPYLLPASDGTATFVGDFVKITGGAAVVTLTDSAYRGMALPLVAQAAASNQTDVGAVVGFERDISNPNLLYRTASTQRVVFVCDDPNVIYEAQEDGDTTPIALADATKNANIIVGSGSTTTGMSAMQIDSTSVATTSTLPVKLLRMVPRVDNDVSGGVAYTKWHCMLNQCIFKAGVAGV